MGGSISAGKSNDELIDHLVEADFIHSPHIEQVFRSVDRGYYFEDDKRMNAYYATYGDARISEPCIYSKVMEYLDLHPGLSFLHAGSGTGYLSTMAGLILGPYGINHGIELCRDIVDFANEQLNNFILNSNAVDEYDICSPSFFVGNCLLLDSNCQQYDRIYCGATIQEEYESYIKNLVKVGGIIIMPFNGKLLKITRTGESTWTSEMLLKVSIPEFTAPPALSDQDPVEYVKLDDFCPPKLKHLCRSNIRAIIRKNIDQDCPNLRNKQSQVGMKPSRGDSTVLPIIFESHLGNLSQSNTDSEYDSDGIDIALEPDDIALDPDIPSRMKVFLEDFVRVHSELLLALNSRAERNTRENDLIPSKKIKKKNMMTKSDNKKQTHSASFKSMSDDSFASDVSLPSSSKGVRKQVFSRKTTSLQPLKKQKVSRKRPASDDQGTSNSPIRNKVKRQVVSKRIQRDPDSEMGKESRNDNIDKEKGNDKKGIKDDDTYTKHMVKRIASLPLPSSLIRYLNYYRDNL